MSAKGTARNACPAPAPDADGTAEANESLQNRTHLVADNYDDFIHHSINHNHSIASAYAYDLVQAQAAQGYANNLQVGRLPFVDYSHHHNRGGGPHNAHPWHNHQHTVFAGHYGVPQLQPLQLQPQPWPQPQPQSQLPAIDQLGLDHSNSTGGGRSFDSIVVKLCPSPSPSAGPGLIGCPPIKPWLQQIERSHSAPPPSLELNPQLRLQPGRSPSSSSSPPYLAPHGEYVPILVSVHKLRHDETLKAKIDNEDVLVMMDYGGANNQTSTTNQSPPPPGTIADASAGQEGGTGSAAAARPKKDLFVYHVPNDMTGGEFYKLFSRFGGLHRARIHHDIVDGQKVSKGYGFVTFKRFSDAVVAVHSLNGYKVSRSKIWMD